MPSPLAHIVAAVTLNQVRQVKVKTPQISKNLEPLVIPAALFITLLPDLDFVPGLLIGEFGRFHNSYSHSLFTGLLLACLIGLVARVHSRRAALYTFTLFLVYYELHVVMDYFTVGRGVMLFWPFTSHRFSPPFYLFYGLHRSDGLVSIRHLWTAVTESLFSLILYFFIYRPYKNKQKISTTR